MLSYLCHGPGLDIYNGGERLKTFGTSGITMLVLLENLHTSDPKLDSYLDPPTTL